MPICRALSSSRAFAPHLRATLPRCLRILQQVLLYLHITSPIHFTSSANLHSCSPATPPASALPCCLVPALHTTSAPLSLYLCPSAGAIPPPPQMYSPLALLRHPSRHPCVQQNVHALLC
ncbi:hypothetical protein B0H13DRAFT_2340268 [Mycena leptocephala]|nr:hypothetical protein B0H13DRAFT_2340268 [Mycena leptocephala]